MSGLTFQWLIGEHLAGASQARLHFVYDQQNAVPVADFADAREVVVGRDLDAAFALNGFQNDGGSFVGDERFNGGGVVERREAAAGQHRLERLTVDFAARHRQRPHRFAVVRAVGRDEIGLAGRHAGDLQGGFGGFGPGVRDKRVLQVARRDLGQLRGQIGQRLIQKRLGRHWDTIELVFDGLTTLGWRCPSEKTP